MQRNEISQNLVGADTIVSASKFIAVAVIIAALFVRLAFIGLFTFKGIDSFSFLGIGKYFAAATFETAIETLLMVFALGTAYLRFTGFKTFANIAMLFSCLGAVYCSFQADTLLTIYLKPESVYFLSGLVTLHFTNWATFAGFEFVGFLISAERTRTGTEKTKEKQRESFDNQAESKKVNGTGFTKKKHEVAF